MENKNELIDVIKYLLGYILKENDELKKANIALAKEKAVRDAQDELVRKFADKFVSLNDDDTDVEDEGDGVINIKVKKKGPFEA